MQRTALRAAADAERRYPHTIMDDIRKQLLGECRRITENSMWNVSEPKSGDDVITSEEREAVAQEYFRAAESALAYIASDADAPLAGRVAELGSFACDERHPIIFAQADALGGALQTAVPLERLGEGHGRPTRFVRPGCA